MAWMPKRWEYDAETYRVIWSDPHAEFLIADVPPDSDHERNGRLLAAAPELLAACEQAAKWFGLWTSDEDPPPASWGWDTRDKLAEVIAKARAMLDQLLDRRIIAWKNADSPRAGYTFGRHFAQAMKALGEMEE